MHVCNGFGFVVSTVSVFGTPLECKRFKLRHPTLTHEARVERLLAMEDEQPLMTRMTSSTLAPPFGVNRTPHVTAYRESAIFCRVQQKSRLVDA